MTQIGIKRLTARHAQDHSAQNNEGRSRVAQHEAHGVVRAHGPQNGRVVDDVREAQHGNGEEPHDGDRTKKLADASRAALLHKKQAKQDHQGQRNHGFLEGRRHHLQTLHRGQHRNGRGDHPIAVENARAKNTHHQQHAPQRGLVLDRLGGQRQHGHQAALAVVVSAQYQRDVFQRDDDRQSPEKYGQDAQHVA